MRALTSGRNGYSWTVDHVGKHTTNASAFEDAVMALLSDAAIASKVFEGDTHKELIQEIVLMARQVVGARGATLFLIDLATEELVVELFHGGSEKEVDNLRLPIGQGIAGYVVATGEALAVENAQNDTRWAQAIGAKMTYRPDRILGIPLIHDNEVIGVLELIDKEDGTPFSAEDLESVSRFAIMAAISVQQSKTASTLTWMLRAALTGLNDGEKLHSEVSLEQASRLADDPEHRKQLLVAARLGHHLSEHRSRHGAGDCTATTLSCRTGKYTRLEAPGRARVSQHYSNLLETT